MNRYSSVSSVVQRMSAKISKDRRLRKSIEKLRAQVYMSSLKSRRDPMTLGRPDSDFHPSVSRNSGLNIAEMPLV